MSSSLGLKIKDLGGLSKAVAGKLKRLNLETVKDLIFYYPYRYEDYSKLVRIADLQPDTQVVVVGKLEMIGSRRSFRSRKIVTEAIVTDDSGSVKVLWFNQPWIAKSLRAGDTIRLWGKVSGDRFNPVFSSPDYQLAFSSEAPALGIIPVYSLTAGLSSRQLSVVIKKALNHLGEVSDFWSQELLKKYQLIDLQEALKQIHFPSSDELLDQAKKRLSFDELFLVQVFSKLAKRNLNSLSAPVVEFQEEAVKQFVASLPFELTLDQKRSAWEIIKDLKKPTPMNRLLEGDVGSGKTIVALLAMYNAAVGGRKSALMSPTEILAIQHYNNFVKLLSGQGINVVLFTRTSQLLNGHLIKKKELLEMLADDGAAIIVGTHALIQEKIKIKDLVLAIVDEQHRFGVKQRSLLKEKTDGGLSPHFLSMTATPIPRSLSLVLFGDLDISIIKTSPAGRKKIISQVVEEFDRHHAYEFIRSEIKAGRQAFVICPLIDPSDKFGFKSVKEEQKKLNEEIFPEFEVGLLHGQLKPEEKEAIMNDFKDNKLKVLVATSVVEVGVDIPNATVMIIEGAERFGLAQLHQFRGRVGRGEHQSHCFFFTDSAETRVISRLKFLASCSDGFELAEFDLKNRGAGSVFGASQSGFVESFKLADVNDLVTVKLAQGAAEEWLAQAKDSDLEKIKNRLELAGFVNHWE